MAASLAAEQDRKDSDNADYEEYLKKKEEIYKRWDSEPKKSY